MAKFSKVLVLALAALILSSTSARRLNEETAPTDEAMTPLPERETEEAGSPAKRNDESLEDPTPKKAPTKNTEPTYYPNPTFNGKRLDWCKNWAENCGKAAADLWCQKKGFSLGSQSFGQATNHGGPTNVIGHPGMVCWADFCDAFSFINCKPSPTGKMFYNPMNGSYRLDWCKNWASQCGAPAANAFCKNHSYGHAADFQIDPDFGRTKTLSGKVCNANYCDGFDRIRCTN